MTRGAWLIIAVLALAAVACGGSAADDAPSESELSLYAYFGFDPGDPEAAAARAMRLERRRQDLVASCMAEAGFEYVPAVNPQLGVVTYRDPAAGEEEVRNRGFGVSLRDDRTPVTSQPEWVDPNDVIWEGLSDSERWAYEDARWGASSTATTVVIVEEVVSGDGQAPEGGAPSAGGAAIEVVEPVAEEEEVAAAAEEEVATTEEEDEPVDFWGEGCEGDADREIYGAGDRVFNELQPGLEEMNQRVTADQRVVEAEEGWTRCMSDRGYAYQDENELYQEGVGDLDRRYREIVPYVDPLAGWSQEERDRFWAERSDEEIDAFFAAADLEAKQAVDQEALAALQREERDLAVANFQCSQERDEVWNAVRVEYETQFVRQNREVLEQMRESVEAREG